MATPSSPPYNPAAAPGPSSRRRPPDSLKRRAAAWLAADAPGGVTRGAWLVVALAAAALLAAGGGAATTSALEASAPRAAPRGAACARRPTSRAARRRRPRGRTARRSGFSACFEGAGFRGGGWGCRPPAGAPGAHARTCCFTGPGSGRGGRERAPSRRRGARVTPALALGRRRAASHGRWHACRVPGLAPRARRRLPVSDARRRRAALPSHPSRPL